MTIHDGLTLAIRGPRSLRRDRASARVIRHEHRDERADAIDEQKQPLRPRAWMTASTASQLNSPSRRAVSDSSIMPNKKR